MGKEMRKQKEKGFPALLGRGRFWPTQRERARGHSWRPSWPSSEGNGGRRRCGVGPTCQRGGVNGADDNGGRGEFDRSPAGGEIPRRFSAVGLVLRRGCGGEAWASAGDHGGGVNLTGGGLGRPVRGVVAGVHGGEVAGEAAGCNRGREVCLVTMNVWRSSSTSLIRPKFTWREERSSPERWGRCGGAGSIGSGRSEGGGRSWCGGNGARAAPFIGAREGERDGGDGERR
jgi:hypothetical protein